MVWRLFLVSSLILFGASVRAAEEKQRCDRRYVKTAYFKGVALRSQLPIKDEPENLSSRPELHQFFEVCVEGKSADGKWLKVSVADQRRFVGWIPRSSVSNDADEKKRVETFSIGTTGTAHAEELRFRNGDTAVLIGRKGDGALLKKGRLTVRSSTGSPADDMEATDRYISEKSVEFSDGEGIVVASSRLAVKPVTAKWDDCRPPVLTSGEFDVGKLVAELKSNSKSKENLPEPTICEVEFRGTEVKIIYTIVGIEEDEGPPSFKMESRVRIGGKEQTLQGTSARRMIWAGDLNGDSKLDVIFESVGGPNESDPLSLYMSDQKGELKFVSSHSAYGC